MLAQVFSRIMEEAFGSVSIEPTIKVTAFNSIVPDARCGDAGTWVDKQSQLMFRFN
jgi:hypothetical protein